MRQRLKEQIANISQWLKRHFRTVRSWAKKSWRVLRWPSLIVLALILLIVLVAIRDTPVWDLLDLLIIPAVLAVGAWWLNKSERENEQRVAAERRHQATLEAYFDRMSELLLDKELRESDEDSEVRTIARTRTLAVLRNLDGKRKGQVIQFLFESGLIATEKAIVKLEGANLNGANLIAVDLREANLRGVDLRRARMGMVKLEKGNLSGATLDGVDLSGANLQKANLSRAGLSRATLYGATLDSTNLEKVNLFGTNLRSSTLRSVELSRATLDLVDLSNADLSGANLSEARLRETDLNGANLSEVDLRGAKHYTPEQLLEAKSLEGATMPDGQKYEDWLKHH